MREERPAAPPQLAIQLDPEKCTGCLACVRACPTKAIRVRGGRGLILPHLCVDCGACVRICPPGAISARVSTIQDASRFKIKVVLPSPVLYTQFGDEIRPNDVLLALTKLGFDYVFDQAVFCEWLNLAISDWVDRHPRPVPAISQTCPVVVRLIAARFPNLIPNIVGLVLPREIGARHIRRVLGKKLGLAPEEIGVFQITPCPAKAQAINDPLTPAGSQLSGALALDQIYGRILAALKSLTDEDRETMLFKSGGFGIGWEMSGGEVEGLRHVERTVSVCGLAETIDVLEQIESGRLAEARYVECRVCPDGCLGGPFTVADRFRARAALRKLVLMYGAMPRVRPSEIMGLIQDGYFESNRALQPAPPALGPEPLKALANLKLKKSLEALLPGKFCAACGAPDCAALAEDVVLGQAQLTDCPFFKLSPT
ncbi:MAG: [Fe-Fe] hydrogenase large subunit C-terminal domain-containing protein [Pseudomonadota bacterium]